MLQRVMLVDGTVGGVPARGVLMDGVDVAIGDNTHDQGASLYELDCDEAQGSDPPVVCPTPDEVIIVFGNDYKGEDHVGRASHPVEELLEASGFAGHVRRYYNANAFLVSPAGVVTLDPPGGHVATPVNAAAAAGGKGCCTII
jgi:hypothetical protein